MEYELVLAEKAERVAVVTLNRPKVNALSLELIRDLAAAIRDLEADPEVGCIVVTATGKFFSAGADVPTIQATLPEPFASGSMLVEGLKLMDIVEGCTKPIVAAVNGIAVGGGCEFILSCHFRMAADTAAFGQPEIKLGIIPGWGGTHRLARAVGFPRALEWTLTGRMISAEEAARAGLVCKVVPAADLAKEAVEFARVLAAQPPTAVRAILRTLHEWSRHPDRGRAVEAESFAEAAATRDAREGVAAFLEKRPPVFTGE